MLDALRLRDQPVRRVIIAGGGRVGLRLARQLKKDARVKIIEADSKRCEYLTSQLPGHVLVLHGDSTDADLLLQENVAECDLFLALTGDDEDNIMGCLLAKRMGARRVLALINRAAYAELVQGSQIDIALSPAQTVIGELLAFVRRGDVEAVYSLRRGAAEALEAVARGDRKTSKVVGRRIEEIPLPRGTQIGALVRGEGAQCQGHHSAPRHRHPEQRSRDRLPAAQAHGARGGEAVPGQRHVLLTLAQDALHTSRPGDPRLGADVLLGIDAGAAGRCLVG